MNTGARKAGHFLFLAIFSFLINFSSQAQVTGASGRTVTQFDSSDRVLPILIESAMINSPLVKEFSAEKQGAETEYQISKKELLRNFSLNSGYNYGTVNNYYATDAVQPVPLWFSNRAESSWSVGAGVRINLEQLLGGSRLRQQRQKLNIDKADAQLQNIRNQVRQQVITQFQALKLARVVYLQRQAAVQSLFVNKELVDKQFREGSIKIGDQLQAEQAYNEAYLAAEEAKNTYQTQVLLLEETVGMAITPLLGRYFK